MIIAKNVQLLFAYFACLLRFACYASLACLLATLRYDMIRAVAKGRTVAKDDA